MEPSSEPFSIDVRRLRILREFDRRGTVAATAAALHLTPSAVSQQISVLAREVGVPLLQRRGRGVVLTGQARLLLGHADAIAAQLERARDDLLAYDSGQRGSVTVGSFSSAISGLLPTALTSLRAERPHLRLAVVEAEPPGLFTHLDTGEIDVAIAVDFAAAPPRTDRRYHRYPLMVDVLDLALPAGHRAATGAPVHLSELAEEPWVVGAAASCCGAVTRAVCAAAGFTPHIRHRVDDWAAVTALVAAGAGVALVPRLVQTPCHPGMTLHQVAGPPPGRHVFAATRAGAQTNPTLTAVVDHLLAAAARPGQATTHLLP